MEIPTEARVYISKVNIVKSDIEDGRYGDVPTSTMFDAQEDYEGESHRDAENEFQPRKNGPCPGTIREYPKPIRRFEKGSLRP